MGQRLQLLNLPALWCALVLFHRKDGEDRSVAHSARARYSWGRKELAFVHCKNCGYLMWWERVTPDPEKKMGVNLRMFEPAVLSAAQVEKLNGADDW
jgi:hypothetical protein